jgi:hypothetical protein
MGRPKRPTAKRAALAASEHLERSESWNGLRAGDPVVVSGIPVRGARWEFRAHVVNRHNGTESIEVVGGRPGDRTVRSFSVERIYATTKKGSKGRSGRTVAGQPSLVEAPQLPFG